MENVGDGSPPPSFPTLLLGNKSDIDSAERQVSHDKAEAFAQGLDMLHYEASALTDSNITDSFNALCVRALE